MFESLSNIKMVITIKKGATKEEVEKQLAKLKQNKQKQGLRKYFGKFPIDGDAVEIQKKLRDEWN